MCPDTKKRFLFVMGFTCPFPGAGWWRISYFAKHFSEKGYQCCVLSSFSLSTIGSPKVVRNEKIYIYNLLPYIGLNNPFILFLNSILASIASIPSFFLFRPVAVIISVPPPDQLLPVFLLSKIMRSKIIIDYRDEFEDHLIMDTRNWGFFYRFAKKFCASLYRNAAMVNVVTSAVAGNLKRRSIHNVKVIYDGVDTKIFQPFNRNKVRSEFHLPQDSFIIAFIGNVYEAYRLDVVIGALEKLNRKYAQRKFLLVLAGGGDIKSIRNLASSLGMSDSVKYFGVINNPTEIAKILSSADCGIIPYDDNPLWQKTYSTKLFEYCAVGLPVIVTVHENSVLASAVKANKMGLIIEPVNSDALASSLEMLSSNKESRIEMGLSALQFARRYGKDKIARELLETIEFTVESAAQNKSSLA